MNEQVNPLRGLVLEGGGAKGAYQLGALLALETAGQRFDVVAGSSVGALNGLLVTTGQLKLGLDYWWNMSYGKVLGLRLTGIISLVVQPLYWIGKLLGKGMGEFADPFEALAAATVLGVTGVALGVGYAAVSRLVGAPHPEAKILVAYSLILAFLLATPYWVVAINLSTFRPSPIRKLIQHAITVKQQNLLIITLTEIMERLDPDNPHVISFAGPAYGIRTSEVAPGPTPIPRYLTANELSHSTVCNALLASAALPHGIFPRVEIDAVSYVDGGVSDNLPIYSALSAGRVQELVVIRLNPGTEMELRSFWQRAERLQRLRRLSCEDALQMRKSTLNLVTRFEPPKFLPLVAPYYWPENVLLIAPSRSLGTLWSGTLNFRRTKARDLLQLGWSDARTALGKPVSIPEKLPVAELLGCQ